MVAKVKAVTFAVDDLTVPYQQERKSLLDCLESSSSKPLHS